MAFAAAVPLLLSSLLARPMASPGTTAIRIEWDAPAGCSTPESFFGGIQSRWDRARRSEAGEQDAIRLAVHLDRASDGLVHGELRLFDGNRRSEVRRVEGATCEEVAEALALTAALALGASARPASSKPDGAPGAASPGPTTVPAAPVSARSPAVPPSSASQPSPSPSPPSPATVPAPPPPSTAPAVPDAAPGRPPLEPERLVTRDEGPPPPLVTLGVTNPPGQVGFLIGLGPVGGQVVSPTFELGASLMARVAFRAPDAPAGGLERSLDLSVTHLRNTLLGASPDVAITWTAIALTPCPGWGVTGLEERFVAEACATVAFGRLAAAEQAVTLPRSATRAWWSAGPVLRVRLAVGVGWLLQVDASAHIPITRRDFVTSTPEETVASTPAIAGMVGFMLAHEL